MSSISLLGTSWLPPSLTLEGSSWCYLHPFAAILTRLSRAPPVWARPPSGQGPHLVRIPLWEGSPSGQGPRLGKAPPLGKAPLCPLWVGSPSGQGPPLGRVPVWSGPTLDKAPLWAGSLEHGLSRDSAWGSMDPQHRAEPPESGLDLGGVGPLGRSGCEFQLRTQWVFSSHLWSDCRVCPGPFRPAWPVAGAGGNGMGATHQRVPHVGSWQVTP